jgi:hypothetical protein
MFTTISPILSKRISVLSKEFGVAYGQTCGYDPYGIEVCSIPNDSALGKFFVRKGMIGKELFSDNGAYTTSILVKQSYKNIHLTTICI